MKSLGRVWGEILRLGFPALEKAGGIPPSLRMTAVKGVGILVQITREIFDENSYARVLQAHGLTHSREAYAHYLEESNLMRERRPRCC